jgi:RNA polymerase sigma factor (sigma-70 family)
MKIDEMGYLDWFNSYIDEIKSKECLDEFETRLLENKGMIFKACNKYKIQLQTNDEYGDLVQEGLIILQKTIEKYKPIIAGRTVKFSSYLYMNLDGGLQAVFNEKFRGIKLTRTAFKNKNTKYVDFYMDNDEKLRMIDNTINDTVSYDNLFIEDLINENLNDVEKNLINLHFYQGNTINEISTMLNKSKQNVSQQIKRILKKLKGGM